MNKQKQPLVSVIMPVYNAGKFLVPAVMSILNQTYKNIELIVVDDGSKDKSWELLKSLKTKSPVPMKIYRFQKNKGETSAANFAFSKSRGAYIARMDSDDIAKKTRIEKQIKYMLKTPRAVLVGAQANVINQKGRIIGTKHVPIDLEKIYRDFGFYQPVVHSALIFRRSLLPNRPNLYNNTYELANDYHTFFELLNCGEFHNLPEELVSYRVHTTNKSLSRLKDIFWQDVKIRFIAITKLNYQASPIMLPVIAAQSLIVWALPESILRELFYLLRGLKKPRLKLRSFFSRFLPSTIKRYAVSLRII